MKDFHQPWWPPNVPAIKRAGTWTLVVGPPFPRALGPLRLWWDDVSLRGVTFARRHGPSMEDESFAPQQVKQALIPAAARVSTPLWLLTFSGTDCDGARRARRVGPVHDP